MKRYWKKFKKAGKNRSRMEANNPKRVSWRKHQHGMMWKPETSE